MTWFMLGLLAFLGAQVCYCVAFATGFDNSPLRRKPVWALPFVGWWVLLLVVLGPDPGALLFLGSDSVLAMTALSDRLTIPADDAVVMVTYTLGQALIVLGVLAASQRSESWCPRPESNWRPFA